MSKDEIENLLEHSLDDDQLSRRFGLISERQDKLDDYFSGLKIWREHDSVSVTKPLP